MKHTYLQAMYERGKGWVKNAGNFVAKHPFLMTGPLIGSAIYAMQKAPDMKQRIPYHNVAHAVKLSSALRPMTQPPLTRQGGAGHILAK